MIEKHTLKPAKGAKTTVKRIGRGNASGRGTTAGKGQKGQRARSGGRNKLKLKGLRAMFLAFPKNRGFHSLHPDTATIKIEKIALAFTPNQVVDLKALRAKGLVVKSCKSAKIVAGGELKSALHLKGIKTTAGAKEVIEKAGGSVSAK
jgi:large subunit ribosomal protein L15